MPLVVRDIMSSPVYSIDIEKTTKDAAEFMNKNRKGFLVITNKGKPAGVISDSDLIKVVARDLKGSLVKLKEAMSKPIVSVSPEDDIIEAVRKMKNSNVHRLPVLNGGKVVGIISLTDIARTTPEMAELLEYRLKMKEEPFEIKEEFTSGICENCGNFSDNLKNINDEWLCEDCKQELDQEE